MPKSAERSPIRAFAAAALLLILAGCGFRPLYGSHAGDPKVNSELSSIYIRPLPDRDGQLVHNALLVRFNPQGDAAASRYRLNVNISTNEGQGAISRDATATRALVSYSASYALSEGDTNLTEGEFQRIYSYDYVPQQYSNISARGDIAKRAAQEIAEEIRNRIAAYFAAGAKARAAATQPSSQQ